jgi:hypothetical protein
MKTEVPEQHFVVFLQELDPCTGEAKQVGRDKPISSEPAIVGTLYYLTQKKPQNYGTPQTEMQERVSAWYEPNIT